MPRFRILLLGLFGFAALLLGGLGIYGVMSCSVSQRTREFGIRIALGADLAQILRSVIAHGLRLTLIGVLIGVAGGLFLTCFLQSLLFGISAADPLIFASVALLLTLVATGSEELVRSSNECMAILSQPRKCSVGQIQRHDLGTLHRSAVCQIDSG